jgi:hypothetical protein
VDGVGIVSIHREDIRDYYLDLPVRTDDIDTDQPVTIRTYLRELMMTLWREKEGFSGKRPFGNSGWHYDLYETLARHGIVPAKFDEDGEVTDVDRHAADRIITVCIKRLCELR